MAVEGKKMYRLYLTPENYEVVIKHLETHPGAGGVSALVDRYIARCAQVIKSDRADLFGNIQPGKMTVAKSWKLFKISVNAQRAMEK